MFTLYVVSKTVVKHFRDHRYFRCTLCSTKIKRPEIF